MTGNYGNQVIIVIQFYGAVVEDPNGCLVTGNYGNQVIIVIQFMVQ